MRRALVAVTLLLLPACSGDVTAVDGAGADETSPPGVGEPTGMPTAVPAAAGPVRTRGLVVVIDAGAGPQVCLGVVAESWPPQCEGPALRGWRWNEHAHERQSGVRWGSYALTGTWDGEALTVDGAIPAALYDAAVPEPTPTPAPATAYSEAELRRIADDLRPGPGRGLPGAEDAHAREGHVLVDVHHDDGSLQAWADETYGEDVVLVHPALVGAEGAPSSGDLPG